MRDLDGMVERSITPATEAHRGANPAVAGPPLVSAIVTFYNQSRFVKETLESVLAQDYAPVEVIVVDDGSTDDTPEACAAFRDRVAYIRQPNRGVAAARNAGLLRARGTLFAFLDGDDLWDRRKLSVQVEAANRLPHAGIIVADGVKFDGANVLCSSLFYGIVEERLQGTDAREVTLDCCEDLIDHPLIQTPSQMLIPAEVLSRVGRWNEHLRLSADYELSLRIAAAGYPITFLADRLTRYRYVEASLSGGADLREFNWGLEFFRVYRVQLANAGSHHRGRIVRRFPIMTRHLARRAYYYGCRHDVGWARRYLIRLAVRSRRPHLVAPYLAAIWAPPFLSRIATRVLRSRRAGHRAGREN
jgi:glycosyltransferase involved in cell wall biosynthesis